MVCKEELKKPTITYDQLLQDRDSFYTYSTYVREKYLREVRQDCPQDVRKWDLEELKRDLFHSELSEEAQAIFDDLTTGELTNEYKAYRVYEVTASLKEIE